MFLSTCSGKHCTLQTTYLLSNLSLTTPSLGLAWTFADFTFFSKFSKAFLSAFCFRNTSKMNTNENVYKFSLLHSIKCYSNAKWISFSLKYTTTDALCMYSVNHNYLLLFHWINTFSLAIEIWHKYIEQFDGFNYFLLPFFCSSLALWRTSFAFLLLVGTCWWIKLAITSHLEKQNIQVFKIHCISKMPKILSAYNIMKW